MIFSLPFLHPRSQNCTKKEISMKVCKLIYDNIPMKKFNVLYR